MLKFLKGVVGSGGGIKDLPYNIGEPYSTLGEDGHTAVVLPRFVSHAATLGGCCS